MAGNKEYSLSKAQRLGLDKAMALKMFFLNIAFKNNLPLSKIVMS